MGVGKGGGGRGATSPSMESGEVLPPTLDIPVPLLTFDILLT